MADIKKLIPIIIHFEAGRPDSEMELPLEVQFGLARKTGWADDPHDAGGATMTGVTLGTYTSYMQKYRDGHKPTKEELRNISFKDWRDIAKMMFWDKWKADSIESQSIANILVDWAWASGSYGIKIPQFMLGVASDGIVGDKTIAALNAKDDREFFRELQERRIMYIDNLIKVKPMYKIYEKGWKRRINYFKFNEST